MRENPPPFSLLSLMFLHWLSYYLTGRFWLLFGFGFYSRLKYSYTLIYKTMIYFPTLLFHWDFIVWKNCTAAFTDFQFGWKVFFFFFCHLTFFFLFLYNFTWVKGQAGKQVQQDWLFYFRVIRSHLRLSFKTLCRKCAPS